MTTAASAWLTGRRDVLIGASFTRAWNERIGKTAKRSKGYPNPEYYSLRYNFKPESIDNENAGTLTPKPGGDGHIFELERPSQQPGESHKFTAVEQPSKDWECVLLWDPATQQLTLEKLESTLNLTHGGRSGTKGRPPSATPPSAPDSKRGKRGSTSTSQGRSAPVSPMVSAHELAEDLELALTGSADADAEGEPDDELELQAEFDAAAAEMSMKHEEEEEEEDDDEMEAVDVAAAPLPMLPPPPPPPVKAKPPPKPKPVAKPRPRPSLKREREDDDIEEEVLAFGEPSRPTKRRATASNHGLALPTAPPTQYHATPTPSELLQPPRITYAGSESSDDSDDGALGEELDEAALERELEQTLAEEVEDEDEGMEPVPLGKGYHDSNDLFGGDSPDDDSSSDDSDDD